MKNSNTLNTRLLPLSILISSLVSGGAMAVSQIATTDTPAVTPIKSTLTGPFERNSAGTSFGSNVDVIDNTSTATRVIAETTPEAESTIGEATGQEGGNATAVIPPTTTPSEQEITEPEQPGLLDKIKDLLGLGEITQEQADALEKNVKTKVEKVDAQTAAKLALESAQAEAQKAAEDALYLKTENVSYQAFAQTEEKIKKEADEAKKKQDKTKEDAIKAVKVNNTPLVPGDKDIAEKVTKAVTDTTKVQGEKAVTLATKITDAKVAQEKKDANTEALAEIDGRLISVSNALIQATGTDKGPLDQKLKEAQQAKTEQDGKELASGGYKELFEEDKKTSGYFGIAENDNGSGQQEKLAEAKKNRDAYNKAAKKELDAIAKAQKAVEAIDAQIVKLKKDKGDIEQEQSTEKGKTGGLDIALSGANDAKDAAQGEFDTAKNAAELAETAAKAIEAAKITDKAVEDATAAYKEAADKAEQTKTALEAAEKAKEDADKLVVTNTGLLNDADQALEQLVTAQNNAQPTLDLPAIDVTIAPAKTQDVIEGTSAIATQVAGGTQNVAKGGKAIDSVITKDGIVNLAAGANAKGTEVTKGTLNNNGGVDTDTVVSTEGKLVLTGGSETAIATSTGAKVAEGGVVTAGDHSVIEKMISSGNVTASGNNTIVRDTTINDGKLSLAGTATANNTTFKGGIFSVEGDTAATKTNMTGGKFAVTGNAKIEETVVSAGDVSLADKATANNTTLTGGTFAAAGDTAVSATNMTGGKFAVTGNATIKDTVLSASDFSLADKVTANNTTLTGGTFTVAGDTAATKTKMTGGEFAVTGNAKIEDTVLNASDFSLADKATANNTTLTDGTFTVAGDAAVTATNMSGGKFAVKGKAKIKDTQLSAGNFTLAENATANDTTLNGGKFDVSNEATATNTTINNGLFTLKDGAHADSTTVNSGTFVMADQSTANGIQLVDSAFTLASGAKASGITKLTGGQAQVAGSLESLSLTGGRADFANSAKASGLLDISADSQIIMNRGADTAQANLNLAGRLELLASDVAQAVAQPVARAAMELSNARAVMPAPAMPVPAAAPVAHFALNDVVMTGGTVDMSNAKNAQLTMASLNGTGNFNLGSVMQSDSVAPLNVSGDANGDFIIAMNSSGQAPTNLNVVNTNGGDARFALANGPVALGNYMTNLAKDANGNFVLTADKSAMTPGTAGILAVANTTPVIFNAELSSIQQRLDKQSTETNQSGMWGSYLNNNFAVKGRAANFDQKLNGMTLGGDKATALADGVLSVGGFASYSSSDIKTDYQSKGKVDSHSFGAYAQYLANSGYYMNAVVKNNQFSQDVNITSINGSASGVSNFSGMGIALKAGKHFNFNEAYVSPYVAMSAFSSGKSNISLSNGMEAQSSSTRSAMGTLGVNAGYRFVMNNGAELKPYAIFAVDHEFAKNNQVTVNQEVFDNNLSGTRVNTGAGMNVNITPNLSVGSEVKLSSGKDIKTPVTINLNVGYSF
ncbi:autotransporter outer membrane beta-barrel domain-containing protein [Yersinia pestis]|uniref:autotransporter outer membrane beta-barrel domain-containing protein n=1 Tax=Yersinia pestis TaxID=632 RepID=UPI0001502096|nr:autotransporter protein [Yersinia pestis Pestoides F]AJK24804.1 outer membrane autotransporter barrel domain protein [Yersinia pestis Pestoides G]AKS58200.1 outer membrane autotransporter barrel domain protein [Yersinia pestis 1412]AKS77446.1 outer membrane autotransporter barrel domain protein [Yersinia pestis 1413]AKS79572.1 outer membrane autotransporter barrel domain protein [Yersinia pestis 1522]AKS90525.1 outer membrane autotransporter barrel domain protein [Yersinia pestis 8787]AKS9